MTKRFAIAALFVLTISIVFAKGAAAEPLLKVDFGTAPSSPVQTGFLNMNGAVAAATASQVFGAYTVNLEGQGFFNTAANGSAGNLNPIATSVKDFYRDYYFVNNTTNDPAKGVNLSIAGLTPNAPYNLTLWSYDADRTVLNATTNTWTPLGDTAGSPGSVIMQNAPFPIDLTTCNTTIAVSSPTGLLAVRGTSSVGNGGIRLNGFKIDDGTADVLAVDFGQQLTPSPVQAGFIGIKGVGLQPEYAETVGAYTVKLTANYSVATNRAGFFSSTDTNSNLVDAGARDFYRDYYYNNSNTDGEGITLMIEGVTPNTEYDLTLWSYDVDRANPLTPAPIVWAPSGSDTTGETGTASNHQEPLPTQIADANHSTTIRVQSTTNTLTIFGAKASGFTGGTRLNGFELATVVPGDFNRNGIVDAADYALWRTNDGSQADYELWRGNFGLGAGGGSGVGQTAAMPEPNALVTIAIALGFVFVGVFRRISRQM